MIELQEAYQRLIQHSWPEFDRYLQPDWNQRLVGLVGPRGSGKTTLLLKHLQQNPARAFYLSADHIFFTTHDLYSFISELYLRDGIRTVVIDEAHRYPDWTAELKSLYDAFPDLQIIFSGSSGLNLIHEAHDLSRRAAMYHLNSLSFREFLSLSLEKELPVTSLPEILAEPKEVTSRYNDISALLGWFGRYQQYGYFPYFLESQILYAQRLLQVIEKVIYEDISSLYSLRTNHLQFFKRLLNYVASIPPSDLSISSIAKHTGIDFKTADHYIDILCQVQLLQKVSEKRSGSSILKARDKILLRNPNLYHAIVGESGVRENTGNIREAFFLDAIKNAGHSAYFADRGDYAINDWIFEIGGRNKTNEQIQGIDNAWLVKDDIVSATNQEIPLWLFGMLW